MKFTKEKIKQIIILMLIVFVGVFLRFYKLADIPNGFYVDEAVTGYNAFSILETGLDEYGKASPIAFRFFGSYSPPLYVYLTFFVMKFLGAGVFSVRFVSFLVGSAGILIVYLFLKSIVSIKKKQVPLIGAFLFSISPWGIFFSRVGYEVNLGFVLFMLGAYLLWLGLSKYKFLLLGFSLLSISMYGAHTERFLVPIFLAVFLIVYRRVFFSKKVSRFTLEGLLLAFIFQIPNLEFILSPAFLSKNSLFYSGVVKFQGEKIARFLPSIVSYPLAFLREFFSQYFTYFSPRSLFFLEDPDFQRSAPELSVFYFWMVIPYLVGMYHLWKGRHKKPYKYLILLLLVIPIPLSLSSDPFSTQRGLPLLFPLIAVISIGVGEIIRRWGKKAWYIVAGLSLFSLVLLWRSYFVLLPFERARSWDYGFDQLARELKHRSEELHVIDGVRMGPTYVELAYFLKYPPEKFHEELVGDVKSNYYTDVSFSSEYKFSNIETRGIDWKNDIFEELVLVGDELSVSENQINEHFLEKLFEIRSPTGEIVFVGYRTNPTRKCFEIDYANVNCK